MGLMFLRKIAVFSSGGRSRGKYGHVLSRLLGMCIFPARGCRLTRIQGKVARSVDETSLVQAVCRSSQGLGFGQVELLKHKVAEGVECVIYPEVFVR